MRVNKYIASTTMLSRRSADNAAQEGRVAINGITAKQGDLVHPGDVVTLDGVILHETQQSITVLLHKPVGYVCSRNGQGSKTIYDLLPPELHHLNPVGRLDKDSSGLLVMTNDGNLAHQLTHPSFQKQKTYEIRLDKPLNQSDRQKISEEGVQLEDGPSTFSLEPLKAGDSFQWRVKMHEGRNRQIRRTFSACGYTVTALHRTEFGPYSIDTIKAGNFLKML